MDKIDDLLDHFPLYTEDLGINLRKPSGRFRWFLASILFGARISEKTASNTYKSFEEAGVDSAEEILSAGWDELVRILDAGGYVRYDFSTATKLLGVMGDLKGRYGSLEKLYEESVDTKDLAKRLQGFKGIGKVTTEIFLRELRGIWDVSPAISSKARIAAESLDIDLGGFEGEALSRVETALVKLSLRYCRKKRCIECPLREFCRDKIENEA